MVLSNKIHVRRAMQQCNFTLSNNLIYCSAIMYFSTMSTITYSGSYWMIWIQWDNMELIIIKEGEIYFQ